jgi:multidrug resistance efflux pump
MNRRVIRTIIGAVAVIVALVIIVGEQVAGVSSNAVINAQVLILRAPIDGEIAMQVRTLGSRVSPNEPLATLSDPRPDDARLIDLQRELRRISIDLERLQGLVAKLQPIRDSFAKQADGYARGRISQLETRLTEAVANLDGVQAKLRDTDATFRRAAELARSGTVSGAEQSRSRAAFEVSTQDLQVARQRVAYLTIELNAAKGGTFLGDSYNDTPYSQQRLRETEQRLAEYETEIRERNERISALKDQISEERVRASRFREARIVSPTTGILWELMSGGGEYVRRAQDVMRIVDCTTTLVTASVRESLYNRLHVGEPVQFRLLGDSQVYDGVIARLAGSGAETIYRSLAIGPSQEHLKRFDVAITSPALAADPANGCAVGRTGRVVFSSRPLDFWRRILSEIGLG